MASVAWEPEAAGAVVLEVESQTQVSVSLAGRDLGVAVSVGRRQASFADP